MSRTDFDADYDDDRGVVQRRVFADPRIYRAEIDTIFGRSWLFVAPSAWLKEAGDFATSRMGRQPVVVWHGGDGELRVFVNRCVRSDEPIASESRGRAVALRCSCHGWAYRSDGRASPQMERVAQVVDWRGLIFATFDTDAPALERQIGDFAWYLDLFLSDAEPADVRGEEALRWMVEANWKLPILAGCGDPFDDPATHQRTIDGAGAQVSLDGGVIAVRDRGTASHEDPRDALAPLTAAIFPNLWLDRETHSLNVVHPIGPTRSEIHSYCLVSKDASPADKQLAHRTFQFQCGPAGLKSTHQAQLWQSVSAAAKSIRRRDDPLSIKLGLGRPTLSNLPGDVSPLISEANQRSFFRWWRRSVAQPPHVTKQVIRMR